MFAALQYVYQQHVRTLQKELYIPLLTPFVNLCTKLEAADVGAKQGVLKSFATRWEEGLVPPPADYVDVNIVSVVLKKRPMTADVLKDALITHRRMLVAGKHWPRDMGNKDSLMHVPAREMFGQFCKAALEAVTQRFRAEPGLFEIGTTPDIASARRDQQQRIIHETIERTIESCDEFTFLCSGMMWKEDDSGASLQHSNDGSSAELLGRIDRLCTTLEDMPLANTQNGSRTGATEKQHEERTAMLSQIRAQLSNLVASANGMSQNVREVKEDMLARRAESHAHFEAAGTQRDELLHQMQDAAAALHEQLDRHARSRDTKLDLLENVLKTSVAAGIDVGIRSTQQICNEITMAQQNSQRMLNEPRMVSPSRDHSQNYPASAPGASTVVSSLPSHSSARPHPQQRAPQQQLQHPQQAPPSSADHLDEQIKSLPQSQLARTASVSRASGEWISAGEWIGAAPAAAVAPWVPVAGINQSRKHIEGEPSQPASSNSSVH
jgi:hypothetical protein